jgi:tRNA pseudouridine55 synthase
MAYDFYRGEVLLINKPLKWSSFQAVNKIKHAIKRHPSLMVEGQRIKPRVGHAGTLDPLATGLLIICTGKKTKEISLFMGQEKEYTGSFFLGATTPCFDLEKEVDQTFEISHISDEMIYRAATAFTGIQQQVPPVYSAVQIGGRRAYELARAGEAADIKAREVEIKEFEITSIEMPLVNFRVVCSKGTYIRSLARDFGLALESGAYLASLCRTRIGEYRLKDAVDPLEFSRSLSSEEDSQERA